MYMYIVRMYAGLIIASLRVERRVLNGNPTWVRTYYLSVLSPRRYMYVTWEFEVSKIIDFPILE